MTNWELKIAIIEKYGSQWKFAQAMGIQESVISKVIKGKLTLPTKSVDACAKALGLSKDVFVIK